MTMQEEQAVMARALLTWGKQAQVDMFVEEAAEALQALMRYGRGRATTDDVIEELVDLDLMLQQMRLLFNDESKWVRWHAYKIARLRSRLPEPNEEDMK